MRVLVVEDDRDLRDVVVEILAEAGHEAVEAADVATARRELASRFHVVLLDLHIAGESAEPLLAELCTAGVPVVLSSADVSDKGRAVAGRWSLSFVPKPFDLDQLLDALECAAGDEYATRGTRPSPIR
jgi:DNA-binding response OmpR family regulator